MTKIIRKYRSNVGSFVLLADEVSELERYHSKQREYHDFVLFFSGGVCTE